MASERVEKFSTDLDECATRPDKYAKEVGRCVKWMQKHQDEALSNSAKSRLVELMARARTVLTGTEHVGAITTLLEMYCALPEGKLTSTKGKAKAVKWLGEDGCGPVAAAAAADMDARLLTTATTTMVVLDVDADSGSVSLETAAGDYLEGRVEGIDDAELRKRLQARFDAYCGSETAESEPVRVQVTSSGSITAIA